jgi:hypothetical protein
VKTEERAPYCEIRQMVAESFEQYLNPSYGFTFGQAVEKIQDDYLGSHLVSDTERTLAFVAIAAYCVQQMGRLRDQDRDEAEKVLQEKILEKFRHELSADERVLLSEDLDTIQARSMS